MVVGEALQAARVMQQHVRVQHVIFRDCGRRFHPQAAQGLASHGRRGLAGFFSQRGLFRKIRRWLEQSGLHFGVMLDHGSASSKHFLARRAAGSRSSPTRQATLPRPASASGGQPRGFMPVDNQDVLTKTRIHATLPTFFSPMAGIITISPQFGKYACSSGQNIPVNPQIRAGNLDGTDRAGIEKSRGPTPPITPYA